ncbi:MAG: tetratricopeptide repeat protein [Acidobacteria bacterium]|nr:tetratricopeptide repeat protein [Acidobacteriota bacterium]
MTVALPRDATPRQMIDAINEELFAKAAFHGTMSLADPNSLSIPQLLKDKRGTCVTLVILYLAIAERLGLEVHAAATPVHLFVRYEGPEGIINIETLEQGRTVEDAEYRRRHKIADSSIDRGLFMRPLPRRAVIAHFLSNRGAIASREGRREDALEDFDAALELYPDLEAAYYNRGLEHLKAGDLEEAKADLTKAIELHPLDAQAFNNRGLSNLKLGNPEAARRDFEEAMRIDPGQKEARENLKLLGAGH